MSVSRVGVCIPSVPSPCSVARAVCSSSSSSSSSLVSRQRLVVSQATDGSDIMHGFQTVGAIATAGATLNKFGVLRLGVDKKYRKEQTKWPKLAASLVIDAIGMSSYAFPVIGESEDALWAPISAALIQLLYSNAWMSALDLCEEGLPFTDFVPTATVAWAIDYKMFPMQMLKNNKDKKKLEEKKDK